MTAVMQAPLPLDHTPGLAWRVGTLAEANHLLAAEHYLGPVRSGRVEVVIVGTLDGWTVAAQVWKRPTSRRLPNDGSWLELSRWCLTSDAGLNAGSRQHHAALPTLRALGARTLVSYSDPSQGHTGSLYRACNWIWAPTWMRLRRPPTGNGSWITGKTQEPKDRWVFHVTHHDPHRQLLHLDDLAAVRYWLREAQTHELRWAARSPYMLVAREAAG